MFGAWIRRLFCIVSGSSTRRAQGILCCMVCFHCRDVPVYFICNPNLTRPCLTMMVVGCASYQILCFGFFCCIFQVYSPTLQRIHNWVIPSSLLLLLRFLDRLSTKFTADLVLNSSCLRGFEFYSGHAIFLFYIS